MSFKKISLQDVFISGYIFQGYLAVYVQIWEGPDAYYQVHTETGNYRKTPGKEGIQKYGEWHQDKEFVEKMWNN